jgi:hypothetical protein
MVSHIALEEVVFTDISLTVNYALVQLLLKLFLLGAKLEKINYGTGNQNRMIILQYFTIMPCDLEGGLLHPPNGPNLESMPLPWTVMVFKTLQDLKDTHTLPGNSFFLDLEFRSAMLTYGQLPNHPIMGLK